MHSYNEKIVILIHEMEKHTTQSMHNSIESIDGTFFQRHCLYEFPVHSNDYRAPATQTVNKRCMTFILETLDPSRFYFFQQREKSAILNVFFYIPIRSLWRNPYLCTIRDGTWEGIWRSPLQLIAFLSTWHHYNSWWYHCQLENDFYNF